MLSRGKCLSIIITAAVGSPLRAAAQAFPVTQPTTVYSGGYTYTLSSDLGPINKIWEGRVQNSSWFKDFNLAREISLAAGLSVGRDDRPNIDEGPWFIWNYGPGVLSSEIVAEHCSFLQTKIINDTRVKCVTATSYQGQLYAYESQPRTRTTIASSGNAIGGTGVNLTSNLGSKLLPEFTGGTLTVSGSGPISVTNNFTLDASVKNAIDAAGSSAIFSGVFSDKAGTIGRITFTNSTPSSSPVITLTGKSTYSGVTQITGGTILRLGTENALPVTSRLINSTRNSSASALELNNFNQTLTAISGFGRISLGTATLTINGPAGVETAWLGSIDGTGSLIKDGASRQSLSGNLTYTGPTEVKAGNLGINRSSNSPVTVGSLGTLSGIGTINASVFNNGTVEPGGFTGGRSSLGTLTINNGLFTQANTGTLALEINGTTSDLLRFTGSGKVSDLAGTVKISGNPTPGLVYTGISGPTAYSGASVANSDTSSVVIASGYKFCREDDACFKSLNGSPSVDATKLQFGWASLDTTAAIVPVKDVTPQQAITFAKNKGGPITKLITDPVPAPAPDPKPGPNPDPKPGARTLMGTCLANTNDPSGCNTALQPGQPTQPVSPNLVTVAKGFDGGNAAIASVVNSGVSGGSSIAAATGTPTGYTTKQAKAAGLPSDFVTVLSAVNSLPTRSAVISSHHQVTAEPYASMQSVALEAMEQFRFNAIALSRGDKAIRLFTEADACKLDDGSLIPASSEQRPTDCKPQKVSQASRWSLLIDATNTQANLDGTNDLASLDYNIFQSTYGLQYDASRQWSIGGAFGYGQANLYNYEYANSTIDSSTYSGGVWAIYRPRDAWKITGLLGYMNLQYDSSRQIDFGGLNRNARATWSGNGFTSALEVQYDWILSANKADRNAVRLKPNTYLSYSLHNQGDITESGADSLNLAIDGHTADSLVYGIGFTLETPLQLARSTRLIPRLSVGYEHDFNGDSSEEHQLSASFADVPALGSLDVLGQNRGANDLNVGLSVELETSDQFSLYAGVGGSFWSNGNEINYGGGLRWRFGGAPKATIAKAQPAPASTSEPNAAPAVEQPEAPSIRGLW
ncbi:MULTISPECIES: autotransporter domain-containing protein [unclassified Cyanobium]|uniref:autotransporter family protein n=1 Tax=unclassified Cyanobium TaxID=2627006 RepID=UPI0020CC26F7|nr:MULTISPECIES: autotransporter domain-containing protein [unclassified Cyanobium]MCP9777765.1 autotransporter domain-containing protein [Cyanobium sp. Tous-M-B4]MCP9875331.1 autotransporter domain-containing protein [Cyanobium sp. A2C-AMD]